MERESKCCEGCYCFKDDVRAQYFTSLSHNKEKNKCYRLLIDKFTDYALCLNVCKHDH